MLGEFREEDVLKHLISIGYKGFSDKGKYYFAFGNSTKIYGNVEKELRLPVSLYECEEFDFRKLANSYPQYKEEIARLLRSHKLVTSTAPSNRSNSLQQDEKIKSSSQKLEIYKTKLMGAVHDPGNIKSYGYSVVMLNPETRNIVSGRVISTDAVLRERKITREEFADREDIIEVIPRFNPVCPDLIFESSDDITGIAGKEPLTYLNTAIPPFWVFPDYDHCPPVIGPFITKLVNHLFPLSDEREKVLDWVHYALVSKNGTALCLVGDRGTGKSTFMEILRELIGTGYTELASEAVLTDKFNGQLHNKRLVYFEEVKLTEKKFIDKVKAWCNDNLAIEKKGSDSFTAENFASMAFLMNDMASIKILPQERRFSIPLVAEGKLNKIIPYSEMARFKDGIRNRTEDVLEEIASFGRFLRDRVPRITNQEPIIGEYFYKVTDGAISDWQCKLRDYILINGEIGTPIQINKVFPDIGTNSHIPSRRSTYEAWLSDYQYRSDFKLANVVDYDPPISTSPLGRDTSRGRKYKFAIIPNSEVLLKYGDKYKKGEDLL